MTARALVLSALAEGPSTIAHPLRARDTELMADGLRALGAEVSTEDPDLWVVRPRSLRGDAEIDVGLAGTVMRFLPPVAALADGPVTFDGDPRARQRPMRPLVQAIRDLGVDVDAADTGGLPIRVHGTGRVSGATVTIDASSSSQLVSGLLLAAPAYGSGIVIRHVGRPVPSTPHLRMTVKMLRAAGAEVDDQTRDIWTVRPTSLAGREWSIEPDLSGAAPFLAAALVTGGEVRVPGWPADSTQPGDCLRDLLGRMGAECTLDGDGLTVRGTGAIHGLVADLADVSELALVLAAVATLADSPSRLTGIGHMRGHETDRLAALRQELCAVGAEVEELDDGLAITPRPLHGALLQTYDDHRMAHAAAVLGLVVPGIGLSDVACTSKTMPEFPSLWESMAATATVEDGERR